MESRSTTSPAAALGKKRSKRRAAETPSLPLPARNTRRAKGAPKRAAASSHGRGPLRRSPQARIACVHLPELPLQILLKAQPQWRPGPVAVVPEDRPEAPLLHLNQVAWRAGLRPGMRYGAAKQLIPDLRAAPVGEGVVQALAAELTQGFHAFSPKVEGPQTGGPYDLGTFYLDPSGLSHIYPSTKDWGTAIGSYLKGRGLRGAVVICDGRSRALALARVGPPQNGSRVSVRVSSSPEETDARLKHVLLEALPIAPTLRAAFDQLALRTVGELLALDIGELACRLGREAAALHAALSGDQQLPLQPTPQEEPLRVVFDVEPPDADQTRLLFQMKAALHGLLAEVESTGQVLTGLRVQLRFESCSSITPDTRSAHESVQEQRIEPARGTRDLMMVVELLRLRLASWSLPGAVESVSLEAETAHAEGDQLHMFACPKRDPESANRALARLRAAFGEAAVTRPILRDAHLPEARFSWEPVQSVRLPETDQEKFPKGEAPQLIRRLLHQPVPLRGVPSPNRAREDTTAQLRAQLGHWFQGTEVQLSGPYRISGGWWARPVREGASIQPVERDYYYAEVCNTLLWIYFDHAQQRWYLQGHVD